MVKSKSLNSPIVLHDLLTLSSVSITDPLLLCSAAAAMSNPGEAETFV